MARRLIVTTIFTLILLYFSGAFGNFAAKSADAADDPIPENIPPSLDLNGGAGGSDYSTAFVSGGPAVSIVDNGLTIIDDDSPNLSSATITITNIKDFGAEILAVDVSGTGIIVAFNAGGLLTLNNTDTVANYQQVLRTATYQNTNGAPDNTTRQISFVVNDGAADSNKPTSSVQIIDPGIKITKTAKSPTIVMGGTAEFTIKVENTGNVALKNISVTDPLSIGCEKDIDPLNPGENHQYMCTESNVTNSFDNEASVDAEDDLGNKVNATDSASVQVVDPGIEITKTAKADTIVMGGTAEFTIKVENTGDVVLKNISVTDPLSKGCEKDLDPLAPLGVATYTCDKKNITGSFTNKAFVVAEDDDGNPVNDDDSADVLVAEPGIEISKTAKSSTIIKDGTAEFTIQVKNSGNVPLKNISVTDPLSKGCEKDLDPLAPLGMATYTCNKKNVSGSFKNTATVAAVDDLGTEVTDDGSADVQVVDPGIEITKTAEATTIVTGDTAKFTIVVKNTGDVPLKNITVTDPLSPGCAKNISPLNPGAEHSYPCSKSNVSTTFTNKASVEAVDNFGHAVSDTGSAAVQVINPGISISKNPVSQTIPKGGTAKFTIEVKNTGNATLYGVKVKDSRALDCEDQYSSLSSGAKKTISCERSNVTSEFTNIAEVIATDILGKIYSATDSAWVKIENPNISIVKGPSTQTILKGETATFNITVVNTSKVVDLIEVDVEDLLAPDCDNYIGNLVAQGEPKFYTCEKEGVIEPFRNEITVTGTNSNIDQPVKDTAIAYVEILDLQAELNIDPDFLTTPGGTVVFSLTVGNEGSVPFYIQSLVIDELGSLTDPNNSNFEEDNRCLDADNHLVEPGESYNCSFSVASDEDPNVYPYNLTATARDENNKPVSDSASASLIVADSALLSVSLEAIPNSLPAPETSETIEEKILITNDSEEATIILDKLIHSELGSLKNVGTCELPQSIEPKGEYSCIFDITIAGNIGDRIYHEVAAAGSTADGSTVGNIGDETVYLWNEDSLINWLPVVSRPKEHPEEDNDSACTGFSLFTNTKYSFSLEDKYDWYMFNVRRDGPVTVFVNDLISDDAQVTVFAKDSCIPTPTYDEHRKGYDGDTTKPNKRFDFIAKKGLHFIRIINSDPKAKNRIYSIFIDER